MLLCEFVCLFVYLFPRRRLGFAQEISYAAASKAQAFADLVGAGGRVFFCLHAQQCKSMQNNMIKNSNKRTFRTITAWVVGAKGSW